MVEVSGFSASLCQSQSRLPAVCASREARPPGSVSHHWLDLKDFPTLAAAGSSVTARSLPESHSRSGPELDTLPSRKLWEK